MWSRIILFDTRFLTRSKTHQVVYFAHAHKHTRTQSYWPACDKKKIFFNHFCIWKIYCNKKLFSPVFCCQRSCPPARYCFWRDSGAALDCNVFLAGVLMCFWLAVSWSDYMNHGEDECMVGAQGRSRLLVGWFGCYYYFFFFVTFDSIQTDFLQI